LASIWLDLDLEAGLIGLRLHTSAVRTCAGELVTVIVTGTGVVAPASATVFFAAPRSAIGREGGS